MTEVSKDERDIIMQILTKKETTELLQISELTLNKIIKKGVLKEYRFPGSRRSYLFKEEIFQALHDVEYEMKKGDIERDIKK